VPIFQFGNAAPSSRLFQPAVVCVRFNGPVPGMIGAALLKNGFHRISPAFRHRFHHLPQPGLVFPPGLCGPSSHPVHSWIMPVSSAGASAEWRGSGSFTRYSSLCRTPGLAHKNSERTKLFYKKNHRDSEQKNHPIKDPHEKALLI